jgi:hypothetical protein
MNAYELADKLKLFWHTENDNLFEDTANMLRQQADRIERKQELIREQTALLVKQNNRIAELEDRLSMYEIKDLDRGIVGRTKDYAIHDLVHRTTPQIKELSDEEIEEVMYKCDWAYDPVAFAKAILKKASEK